MAFEIFKETGTRTKEFVSVTETKAFGLSRAFLDKQGITGEHKAVIFYDPDTNKVALYVSLNNPKFGFALRIANEKHGATIIAKSFFELKGIDAKRYADRYSDFETLPLTAIGQQKEGTVYVVALKERSAESDLESQDQFSGVVVEEINDEPINLDDKPVIILDGTLPSFEGAKIKIRKALKAGKTVEVHCVLPESLLIAFIAFLNRDRKFPVEHFYSTHSSARKTILEVAKGFPDVAIKLIVSHGAEGAGMSFTEKQFESGNALIEFLEAQQYTEEEIRNKIYHDQ